MSEYAQTTAWSVGDWGQQQQPQAAAVARIGQPSASSHTDIMRLAGTSDLMDDMDAILVERSMERAADIGRRARDLIGEDRFIAQLMLPLAQGYVTRSIKRAEVRFNGQ